ncbi:MAG: hypothetical protein JST40_06940 [Armatimonadetes bacterium]|nr:hypothetical protein [Armatimonadota bacterium]
MYQQLELDPAAVVLVRQLAGPWADRYLTEALYPALQGSVDAVAPNPEAIRDQLADPFWCLNAFFDHYAFARRGRDRAELSILATKALARISNADTFETILKEPDGTALWESFVEVCAERKRKPYEQLNRGLLAGMLELAQEIYQFDGRGSIAEWLIEGVVQNQRIEPHFLRVVDIRGVGPKISSTFLRDMVLLFDLEDKIDNADRLYVQPVDRWLRLCAQTIVPEFDDETAVDWIIAGKVSKYCRRCHVSGIRFNMGASYFGLREVHEPNRFHTCATELVAGTQPSAKKKMS